jgi:formate hydrogenlyase subunit 3/multisubunit Na+/H+ antiporter MnhD subunit
VNLAEHAPALLVMAPLAGAAVAFVVGRRWAAGVGVAAAAVTALLAAVLACDVLARGPRRYELGGWGAPLGIDLVADGMAAAFVLLAAAIGVAVTVYATGYFGGRLGANERGQTFFWPLWLFMWTALNGLLLTGDVFNVYVCQKCAGTSAVLSTSAATMNAAPVAAAAPQEPPMRSVSMSSEPAAA